MLAAEAKRSDLPKQQLFIDSRTKTDSPLPAQNLPRHLIKDEDRLGFPSK